MLVLIIVSSLFWFGVGLLVGWQRAKTAYRTEMSVLSNNGNVDVRSIEREAITRATLIFFGWAIAGILGALIWLFLYIFHFVIGAEAESGFDSATVKKNGFISFLVILGLLSITDVSLRSIENNVDNFVIKLAFLFLLIGGLSIYILISDG